ncbi:hypothetical protein DPMN_179834 [Dreissena polymorpha]|uniref:Uncharacterized protein n=1 Tax=Dreissena polymorpha TaxID=45954 RepID=A0A9D4EFI2_DREPO|nr:hypothetical protein DPMN_179834 [Dreissena polymorpha]
MNTCPGYTCVLGAVGHDHLSVFLPDQGVVNLAAQSTCVRLVVVEITASCSREQ